jgi:hypothetical protein
VSEDKGTMQDKNISGKQLLEKYEEKRKYPRIIVDCPVSMVLPNSKEVEAQAHDVSPGGLQLRSGKQTARILNAENEKLKQGTKSDFEVNFILPLEGRQEKLQIRCKLAYTVKLEENYYAIGLQFTRVEGSNRKILRRFIESSMEPL